MDTISTTYLERYQLCTGENGTPVTLQRGPGGVTYKAADLQTGREVAVKLLPSYSFAPAQLQQLEVEAKAAQLVEHPNVARLYDFGLAGGDVVFVTEVLDGSTLDAWVSEHGPLPAAAVVRVALQVVAGLAAAAFHSVVHRSIRPGTLMIVPGQTPDGEWPLVKVLDFGGIPPTSSASEFSVRPAGSSADFASPEQLKGYPVDFRSEMYSLGCTLWYLLTGAPPVPGTADKGNRIPKALRPILAQMVALDPMQRPQDPVLLQGQLRECLALLDRREATARKFGMPVAAPVTPIRDASRNTMALLKPLALAALILVLVGIAASTLPHVLRPRTTAKAPLGVPVGVPDATAAPAVVAAADTPAAANAPAAAPSSAPERTPGETDVAERMAGATTESAARASATPADENAAALVSITPPVPTASADTAPSPDSTSEPPVVAANSTDSSTAAENVATPEPAPTNTVATPIPRQEIVQESTQSPDSDSSVSADNSRTSAVSKTTAPTVPSSTPAKETAVAKSKPKRAEPIRRNEVRPAQPVTDSDFANAPPIPRGAKRARYLGTTADGDLVFGLPSDERGFVAPPAYQPDQRRRSRRQRRVAPTPEPRPEMVLPAEPVDPEDE